MSNVEDLVFKRFRAVYGSPKSDDVAGYLDEYELALGGYSPEALRRGIDRVIKTYKGEWNWPVPGFCRDCCNEAASEIQTERLRSMPIQKADELWTPPTPEQRERAKRLADEFRKSVAAMSTDGKQPVPATNRDAWRAKFGDRSQ